MLNSLFHIVLIFVLCFTASTIPINIDAGEFLRFPTFPIHQKAEYTFHVEKTDWENPQAVTLQVQTNDLDIQPEDLASLLQLDILQKDRILSTLDHNSFIENILEKPNTASQTFTLTINLEQQHLNLPNGNYIFRICSAAPELKHAKPIELKIKYAPLSAYIPAAEKIPRGMIGLTLYFPDPTNRYLVPISRFIKDTKTPIRAAIENLQQGSDPSLGFESPIIPDIKKLQLRRDKLIVYLPSDLDEYNYNKTTGTIALNSLVNSLTSFPGINKVQFSVNGKKSEQIFHHYTTDMSFEKDKNPKVYLAMDYDQKRLLFIPNAFSASDPSQLIPEMFSALKTAAIEDQKLQHLIAPIPKDVVLHHSVQKRNVLTLNLSKEFLNAYPNRLDLQRWMVDSMLHSFMSIDGIDQVQILVENQKVSDFGGINLSEPLKKPQFINPEKE